jgi:outer membrane protein TolC
MHRVPDHWLPPPPPELGGPENLPAVEALRQIAVERRPDLAALSSRIQAERKNVELACKEFYPDFEFMGRYDAFWTDRQQRPQVGMNMNVPLNQNRRRAAVNEAMFRVSKMQSEYNQQVDNVRNEVESAFARLDESRNVVRLYDERILPAAQDNVHSAASEYRVGRVDFLRLIAAQQELIMLQENDYEAIADYFRRRAELERVVGTALSDITAPAAAPPALDD